MKKKEKEDEEPGARRLYIHLSIGRWQNTYRQTSSSLT
jgi:hypothetical protein